MFNEAVEISAPVNSAVIPVPKAYGGLADEVIDLESDSNLNGIPLAQNVEEAKM